MEDRPTWRKKYALVEVVWEDSTSMAAWLDEDELQQFITDATWNVTSVGYIVAEDGVQITLCARITNDGKHFGLLERIPKRSVLSVVSVPREPTRTIPTRIIHREESPIKQ